jgi:hypothetical protein
MGEVVYNDGMIAVVQHGSVSGYRVDEALVKTLLEVTEENVDSLLDTLLPYRLVGSLYPNGLDGDDWSSYAASQANKEKLYGLGWEVSRDLGYCRLSPRLDKPNPTANLLYIPATKRNVLTHARYTQYLASLYLLSRGDERHDGLLSDVALTENGLSFTATLPRTFVLATHTRQSLERPVYFDPEHNRFDDEHDTFEAPATVPYETVCYWPYGQFAERHLPNGQTELKAIAASALLLELVNFSVDTPYRLDASTLSLKRSEDTSIASVLADSIISNKISACPWCGRPMLRLRRSSKPFCKKAHQTRYSEKAKAFFDKGASAEEVAEAFPYIKRATIENWQR